MEPAVVRKKGVKADSMVKYTGMSAPSCRGQTQRAVPHARQPLRRRRPVYAAALQARAQYDTNKMTRGWPVHFSHTSTTLMSLLRPQPHADTQWLACQCAMAIGIGQWNYRQRNGPTRHWAQRGIHSSGTYTKNGGAKPNCAQLSEGVGGTFGRPTWCNTAGQQELLDCTH